MAQCPLPRSSFCLLLRGSLMAAPRRWSVKLPTRRAPPGWLASPRRSGNFPSPPLRPLPRGIAATVMSGPCLADSLASPRSPPSPPPPAASFPTPTLAARQSPHFVYLPRPRPLHATAVPEALPTTPAAAASPLRLCLWRRGRDASRRIPWRACSPWSLQRAKRAPVQSTAELELRPRGRGLEGKRR